MNNHSIFSLIMTTHHNCIRVDSIKNTWGKHINHLVYGDYEDLNKNIIKVSNDYTYHSNEEKQINCLNIFKQSYISILDSYDWILLADDDTFINYKLIFEMIKNFDEDKVYGYILNEITDIDNPIRKNTNIPLNFSYIAGGNGCFISTKLIKKIDLFKNYKLGYSDVSLGFNFMDNNIKLEHINNCCRYYSKLDTQYNISNLYSFHYVTDDDSMMFLYNNI